MLFVPGRVLGLISRKLGPRLGIKRAESPGLLRGVGWVGMQREREIEAQSWLAS